MDAILFLPYNFSSDRSWKLLSSPFHFLLASSELFKDNNFNSLDRSLRGCIRLLSTGRRISHFILRCSLMNYELKPKPVRKFVPVTDSQELEEDSSQISRFLPSALCHRIESLVFFKKYKEAIDLFEILELSERGSCICPEALSTSIYDSLITACICLKSEKAARSIFRHMIRYKFDFDLYMMNRVLLMHLKCGMIAHARRLFSEMPKKNLVSWSTIISGLVDTGSYDEALQIFLILWDQLSSVGSYVFTTVIRAAAGLASVTTGFQLHSIAFKIGLSDNLFVSCAFIDMYGKCGCVDKAQLVFDKIPEKHVVGWNAIISGYALNGYSEEALELYHEMQKSNVKMDHFTYSIILRICARLGSLEQGKQAHAGLVRNGFGTDMVACTTLIDLYCKWGRMSDARNVFDKMSHKNVISWNAMIGGYGNHGMGAEAVVMFESMLEEGVFPNHVTFLAVLGACSYAGMLRKGREIFELMSQDPKMKPRAMHYACIIELLGREGLFDEALALIRNAPFSPTVNMWAALFRACRFHRNLELGTLAAEKLFGLEPEKLGNYIVLLNIYNSSGRLNDAAKVLNSLMRKGLRLVSACSWIEIKKKPHIFLFGDNSHPHCNEIYEKLGALMQDIVKEGYIPKRKCLFPDVLEHDQIVFGCHSEILTITFGLLSTPNPLQILQGHRVCDDCHCIIKLITTVTGREIVVRDASRFHHFVNGACSCADYW